MHSTPYDLSPRPCPPPWCPLHSGPCWSSRGRRGRRANRTTWTLTSCLHSTASPSPAGSDVLSLWTPSILRETTDKRIRVDRTILSLIYFYVFFFSLCVVELLGFLFILHDFLSADASPVVTALPRLCLRYNIITNIRYVNTLNISCTYCIYL